MAEPLETTAPPMPPTRDGLAARWRARSGIYSRPVWALMIALDVLPWPWGEDIAAKLFGVIGLLRRDRRTRALAWARRQPGQAPWRLAHALCAFLGRWAVRSKLLGLRGPDDFRRRLAVEGEERLGVGAGRPGVILLAFHIGPPNADIGLKIFGHRVSSVVWGRRDQPGWWGSPWRSVFASNPDLVASGNPDRWLSVLYRARRILLDGGIVYVMADGAGRELVSIPLPGGPVIIRAGWFNLQRHTRARVLPILTHTDGRRQVIAIHPELSMTEADLADGRPRWQAELGALLADYVRRFPEQCFGLAFRPWGRAAEPGLTAPRD
jgi:lauroyl/myristoyl acyltransferase